MALIVKNEVKTDTHSTSYQSASSDDELFGEKLAQKPRQYNSSEKLLDNFLKEKHDSQGKAIATLLSNTTLRELLVKYNTAYLPVQQWNACFTLGRMRLIQNDLGLAINILKYFFFFWRFVRNCFLCSGALQISISPLQAHYELS